MRADSSGVGCHNDAYEGRWGTAHPPPPQPTATRLPRQQSERPNECSESKVNRIKTNPVCPGSGHWLWPPPLALAPGPPVLLVAL